MTAVKQVARGICKARGDDPDELVRNWHGREAQFIPRWMSWRTEARAALAAMRTPTEAMVEAMFRATQDQANLVEMFESAIDAAMAE